MKNQIKTIAGLVAGLMLMTSTSVNANSIIKDTTGFIINGKILKSESMATSKCKLELFNENQIVDSFFVKTNKPFEIKLKKNVWYTLRIVKEGHLPQMISFNTAVGTENVTDNSFYFETALFTLEQAKYLNKDLVDFPVGHVALNKETNLLEAREVYSTNYLASIFIDTTDKSNDKVAAATTVANADFVAADIAKEYISNRSIASDMC